MRNYIKSAAAAAGAGEVRKRYGPVITFSSESRIRLGKKSTDITISFERLDSMNKWVDGRGKKKIIRIANYNEVGVGRRNGRFAGTEIYRKVGKNRV